VKLVSYSSPLGFIDLSWRDDEFLETRIISQPVEHWIEPEQGRVKRRVTHR